MSLYRQAGGRSTRAIVATLLAGVAVGLLGGYLLGRGSVQSPSTAQVVAEAREALQPVADGLQLVPIEYEGAVSGGKVRAPTEYEGVGQAVERARESLAGSEEDLRAIDAAGYAAARRAIARLSGAIDALAPTAKVDALARRAQARVSSLAAG